jgi:hypothetical protein
MKAVARLVDRLRHLDDRILGHPTPDHRPLREQLLRPRPAIWSRRGRFAYALIVLAMIGALIWLPELIGIWAVVVLLAAAFVVTAADEKRRSAETRDR